VYGIRKTAKFNKDLKLIKRRSKNLKLLGYVVNQLIKGQKLPRKFADHALIGNYKGYRECHVEPDWLLIYRVAEEEKILYLIRTGTHSDLL